MDFIGRGIRIGFLAGLALAIAASAARADSFKVGSATLDGNRDASRIDWSKWSESAPRAADQRNVNKGVSAKDWSPTQISTWRAQLAAAAAKDPVLAAKLAAIAPQRLPDDLHPVEFVEGLKLQTDKDAQLITPPANKIKIVDQEALAAMTPAQKAAITVKYRKTTIIPKTVEYKPLYQTIQVAYPG